MSKVPHFFQRSNSKHFQGLRQSKTNLRQTNHNHLKESLASLPDLKNNL
jgi:hypothetical protein